MSVKNKNPEGTRIDLGDDLLERTTAIHSDVSMHAPDFEDSYESAEILLSEGLIEDAKKVLRKLIRTNPNHYFAKKKLEEIQQAELKALLQPEEVRPSSTKQDRQINAESVLRELDRDLNLGISNHESIQELTVFTDIAAVEAFIKKLDNDLTHLTINDRLDLGIAFLD